MSGCLKLFREVLHRRRIRGSGGISEGTEGTASDLPAEIREGFHLGLLTLPVLELLQHPGDPVGALAARRALPAGLVLVELQPPSDGLDDAHGLVEHHGCSGAEHGPGLGHRLVREWEIEVLVGKHRDRRSTRKPELH